MVITRNGLPLARLMPPRDASAPRVPGIWRGKGWIAEDFDELPEEAAKAFGCENNPLQVLNESAS